MNLVSGSSVVATYAYDAFGNPVAGTEWAGIDDDKKAGIRYAGYQYDSESGYYYLNARMYDPKTARFLQEDTYRGSLADPLSLNLYTYCHNDPIQYTDPTGHSIWGKIIGGIIGGPIGGAISGGSGGSGGSGKSGKSSSCRSSSGSGSKSSSSGIAVLKTVLGLITGNRNAGYYNKGKSSDNVKDQYYAQGDGSDADIAGVATIINGYNTSTQTAEINRAMAQGPTTTKVILANPEINAIYDDDPMPGTRSWFTHRAVQMYVLNYILKGNGKLEQPVSKISKIGKDETEYLKELFRIDILNTLNNNIYEVKPEGANYYRTGPIQLQNYEDASKGEYTKGVKLFDKREIPYGDYMLVMRMDSTPGQEGMIYYTLRKKKKDEVFVTAIENRSNMSLDERRDAGTDGIGLTDVARVAAISTLAAATVETYGAAGPSSVSTGAALCTSEGTAYIEFILNTLKIYGLKAAF